MGTKAGIYVRTSSEHQAGKASPDEQERDCRALAERHGLTVAAVYRDTERYRVRGRMVDPSGTRTDRPGLLAMLADAKAGRIDTILAWKEDRLYRGLRAMLIVLDEVQNHKLDVILAKESFDARMAPVKAWVAGMELDSLKERMTMGVKARLRAGKANTGQDRYGYRREGERIVVVDEEAQWVRQVFDWYNDRVPILEIRRRLIAAGAPQKGSTRPRKIQWAVTSIQSILTAAYEYAHGIKIQTRAGEAFTIPVEPLITEAVYRRFEAVRAGNKSYPARHMKRDYLIAGLLYCPCGRRWGARMSSYRKRGKERAKPLGVYYCPERHIEMRHADCPKTIGSHKADAFVWAKVLEVIGNPDLLLVGMHHYMSGLQERAKATAAERERITRRLDELAAERQWVITQARKGAITTADMEMQLATLTMEENYTRGELVTVNTIDKLTESADTDWQSAALAYLEDLRAGVTSLDAEPQTEEERSELFRLRRRAVQSLVERIEIGQDRKMSVVFRFNALPLLGLNDAATDGSMASPAGGNYLAGTYTHI
jgi:DNA invertase Pin-like site-specific DNA recombinase